MATLNCQNCRAVMSDVRATTKYCSDKCRKAASRGNSPKAVIGLAPDPNEKIIPMTPTPVIGLPKKDSVAPDYRWPSERAADNIQAERKKNASEAKASVIKKESDIAVPQSMAERKQYLIAKMNARLEMKGFAPIQEKLPPIEFVRTGYDEIDRLTARHDMLGFGGFPRKHITEVFGTKGAGKTSLMKQIVNFNTYNEDTGPLSVLYVDIENGLVNPPANVIVSNNPILEEVEEMVCRAIEDDDYDLIVVDSVAMLSSRKEMEADRESMMEKPKAMGKFIRRLNAFLRVTGDSGKLKDSNGTAVVFINQLRDTGNSFGVMEFTPGGRALEYGASLRLELRSAKADKIIKDGRPTGQKVRVTVKKSRFNGADVDTTVVFPLKFSEL